MASYSFRNVGVAILGGYGLPATDEGY